jgi:hypothetical protein
MNVAELSLKSSLLAGALFLLNPFPVQAQSSLAYFEAQTISGYSTAEHGAVFYSMSQAEAMQKPSLGFDYLRRLSGEWGDYGALALQVRLAYNHRPESDLEAQVYNAYFKYKAGWADLWIGHDRPAFGLASYLDSHGLLLQPLGMHGFGFDRDWGGGAYRDLSWGSFAATLTAGSGMPLEFDGNWLVSARLSKGVLSQENYNIGFSAAWGRILETIGYDVISLEPLDFRMALLDWTYLWTRYESRFELAAGERAGEASYAVLWRFGLNLLEENRLKLELQPLYEKMSSESNTLLAAGVSFLFTPELTLRSMYEYDDSKEENLIIAQVYYYKGI